MFCSFLAKPLSCLPVAIHPAFLYPTVSISLYISFEKKTFHTFTLTHDVYFYAGGGTWKSYYAY